MTATVVKSSETHNTVEQTVKMLQQVQFTQDYDFIHDSISYFSNIFCIADRF